MTTTVVQGVIADSWIDPITGEVKEEPWLWTQGKAQDLMNHTHRAYLITQDNMARCSSSFSQSEIRAWRMLRDNWARFYKESSNGWDRLWSATPATTVDYSNELISWRQFMLKRGCQVFRTPLVPRPHRDPSVADASIQTAKTIETAIKLGALGLGVYALIKLWPRR